MFAKRFLISAMSVLLLTACESGIDGEQYIIESLTTAEIVEETTKETTEETTIVFLAETTVAEETTTEAELTDIEKYFADLGGTYFIQKERIYPESDYLGIPYKDFEAERLDPDNEFLKEVTDIYISSKDEDIEDTDFISYFPNLNCITISTQENNIDIDRFINAAKDLPLINISIYTDSYSQSAAEKLITAFPDSHIRFCAWSVSYDERPDKDVMLSAQPFIAVTDTPTEWECHTSEITNSHPDLLTWNYPAYEDSIVLNLSNLSDTPQTVNSVQIMTKYDEVPVLFADGSDKLTLDIEVPPMTSIEYAITYDMLDYHSLKDGMYKLKFEYNEKSTEVNFYVSTPAQLDFLNNEQRQLLEKTEQRFHEYFGSSQWLSNEEVAATNPDEFMAQFYDILTEDFALHMCKEYGYIDMDGNMSHGLGDGGSDITFSGRAYLPVYADENKIEFQLLITHAHSDFPYNVSFETLSCEMVNTENGWRINDFKYWH